MSKFLHLLPVLLLFTLCLLTMTKAPVAGRRNNRATRSWTKLAPSECKGRREGETYCRVRNYEKVTRLNLINKQEFSRYEPLFGMDAVELPSITQHMSGEMGDLSYCSSRKTTVFPQMAETRNGGWMYIVNNAQFKQGIQIEICDDAGASCHFSDTLPNQYTSSCKQLFTYRILVAVAPNKNLSKQHFKIPSYCKCVIKQN